MRPEKSVAQKPVGKKVKGVIPFRCPPDLEEWIDARIDERANVKRTDVVIWALENGRNYVEATKAFDARIKEYARANDLTELGALKRIVDAGLAALDKK